MFHLYMDSISVQTGSGSTTRKKSLIVNLLCSCREKEMKFLVRTLVRNLRIGAMMRTVLPALAQAIVMNSADGVTDNLKDHIRRLSSAVVEAYNILPNLDLLIPSLMEKGIDFSASTLSMVPGVPIKPMLAKITNGAPQVLKIFQDRAFTCEYKYEGQRAQIHRLPDGSIRVFSRNGDETTSKFPDLIDIVKESCVDAAVTFILDAEVVAIDRKNSLKLMSFQELSSRERGSKDSLIAVDKIKVLNINWFKFKAVNIFSSKICTYIFNHVVMQFLSVDQKVNICIFVFDVMFANGEQLLNLPLRQRRKYLSDLFGEEKPGYFEYAREMTVESQDADGNNEATLNRMNSFLDDALRYSCEGIVVKSLNVDAGYTPSKRSDAWLKVKRDYVEGLRDSLDLVPIGAWHGNGRKAGWFSPFLMACYNPDTEEYQSVCRVMSGISDAFYTEMKEFFSDNRIISKKPPDYRTDEVPDMWFTPEVVWQIRGADFTVSPVHHAAIGLIHPSRAIRVNPDNPNRHHPTTPLPPFAEPDSWRRITKTDSQSDKQKVAAPVFSPPAFTPALATPTPIVAAPSGTSLLVHALNPGAEVRSVDPLCPGLPGRGRGVGVYDTDGAERGHGGGHGGLGDGVHWGGDAGVREGRAAAEFGGESDG
ncbi:DNA ligase 1 [Phtheirospermum japonicum]|uniref:DNA ligase (ATP) n=1 Tax=Phtheirospermum japonicum TaxID=374723 RepID=A0A830CPU1_9LAMI|nr:DNA ligase 1 [Phtheirospermum japonicum]